MPLPPLPDPDDRAARVSGFVRAVPVSAFLFSTLLAFNAAQTASLAVRPVSPRAFRKFNRWAANTWWGWCVTGAEMLHGTRIIVTGDHVPPRENALVLANHQQMPDITFLMAYARSKDRLGDMKWFAKDIIKYVPGVGWGMWVLDCPFVKRDWAKDRESIDRTFARICQDRIPVWLITFPEGTRITPDKAERSRQYAREHGLPQWDHVLVPRTKGFVATVHGLRGHLDAIYDVTIGYERGVPTLWQFVKGFARVAHLHVRRHPMDDMPDEDESLTAWLIDRFDEKNGLLDAFYRDGKFPE
jgi:1-acyl-sn-glycerol-3-phosphate acyltransferase